MEWKKEVVIKHHQMLEALQKGKHLEKGLLKPSLCKVQINLSSITKCTILKHFHHHHFHNFQNL